MDGRSRRVYGRHDAELAKHEILYYSLIPIFPKGFVETVEDAKVRGVLEKGTVGAISYYRLEASAALHRLITAGIGRINDVRLGDMLRAQILEFAGLSEYWSERLSSK